LLDWRIDRFGVFENIVRIHREAMEIVGAAGPVALQASGRCKAPVAGNDRQAVPVRSPPQSGVHDGS
jgi:hypothetical protein